MNQNKNDGLTTDQMLEDFLSDNHVEDGAFSENVLASLPQQPRLMWVTDFYPIMGILAGLLAAWKFDVLNPQTAVMWTAAWFSKAMLYFDHFGSISTTVSTSFIVGVVVLLGFFASEKIKDI